MSEDKDQELEVIEEEEVKGEQREPEIEEEGAEEAVDVVATLRQELEETQAREAEYLDGWQRARAELANARKRFQRERELAYANAKADVLNRVLPIVDDFERAAESLPEERADLPWLDGILMIQRKLQRLLDQEGVEPIEAVGQEFDPYAHQAVTHEPSEEVPAGHVIAEVQKGYRLGERVLRPSVVRVSSGPPPEPEPEGEQANEE